MNNIWIKFLYHYPWIILSEILSSAVQHYWNFWWQPTTTCLLEWTKQYWFGLAAMRRRTSDHDNISAQLVNGLNMYISGSLTGYGWSETGSGHNLTVLILGCPPREGALTILLHSTKVNPWDSRVTRTTLVKRQQSRVEWVYFVFDWKNKTIWLLRSSVHMIRI